ncbi:MAG: AIM24 family protein [Thermovirgaceae bacterium]|nr:AIM24 family protein [Thermovirgaceae bacterium]
MRYEIVGEGAYPAVRVSLAKGDRITAESGAMASMDGCVDIETEMKGAPYRVDTGNIVMFDEGLVAEFNGHGMLVMQTRSIPGFVGWLSGKMPRKTGG